MILTRLVTTIVLLPTIIIILFFFTDLQFMFFIVIISMLAAWEWTKIFNLNIKKKFFWFLILLFLFCLFIFFSFFKPCINKNFYFLNLIIFISIFWWIIACFLLKYYPKYNFLWIKYNFLCLIFGTCIILPFFCAILLLKQYGYYYTSNNNYLLILYVLFFVCVFDSGSYLFGSTLGKKKIAPKISPKKTWVGIIGGIVTSVLYNLIFFLINPFFLNKLTLIISFVFILLGSILGDLTESMFKRSIGIKNSSNLIPGHGGILDRTDSLMSSFPIFAFILFIFYIF